VHNVTKKGHMKTSKVMPAIPAKRHKPRRDYIVPALDKGLDVLETLAASATPLSLTQLARKLRQTPGSVFRLLSRLEGRSYVIRGSISGQYSLSLKLFELAHTHSPVERIISVSVKPMRELAVFVRESVHLSVLSHGRLVVLLDASSPLRVSFTHEVGAQFPPVLTNSGRLLLAYLSPEDLQLHLNNDPDYERLTTAQREAFREELRRIRRNSYAVSSSEDRAGMKDIAVLVGNPAIGTTAALAIACLSGGKNKADIHRLVCALQKCSAEITGALGVSHDGFKLL
jgi:DNA-binding IclR family transcriptional regulator